MYHLSSFSTYIPQSVLNNIENKRLKNQKYLNVNLSTFQH